MRHGGFYVGVVSCCGFLLEFELALKVAHRIFVGIDLRDLQAERHMAAGANIPFTQSTGLGGAFRLRFRASMWASFFQSRVALGLNSGRDFGPDFGHQNYDPKSAFQ